MRARKRPYLPRLDRSPELFARLSRHLGFFNLLRCIGPSRRSMSPISMREMHAYRVFGPVESIAGVFCRVGCIFRTVWGHPTFYFRFSAIDLYNTGSRIQ